MGKFSICRSLEKMAWKTKQQNHLVNRDVTRAWFELSGTLRKNSLWAEKQLRAHRLSNLEANYSIMVHRNLKTTDTLTGQLKTGKHRQWWFLINWVDIIINLGYLSAPHSFIFYLTFQQQTTSLIQVDVFELRRFGLNPLTSKSYVKVDPWSRPQPRELLL